MRKWLRRWHRRLGLASALAVLWLAVSGIIINHGDRLQLPSTMINWSWLNAQYGMAASDVSVDGYKLDGQYYYCYDGRVRRGAESITSCDGALLSIAKHELYNDSFNLLLLNNALLIVDVEGILLEKIAAEFLPVNTIKVFSSEGKLLLLSKSVSGNKLYEFDINTLVYKEESKQLSMLQSSVLEPVPKSVIEQSFPGISLERVLLDAHSGRVLGSFGVLMMDAFALIFVVLSLSGLVLYFRKR